MENWTILPAAAVACLLVVVAYYAGMNQGDEDCHGATVKRTTFNAPAEVGK